jgi:integrase
MTTSNRRSRGVGSVYRRADRRWVARWYDDEGKARSAYGPTRREAIAKRTEALARVAAGTNAVDSTMKVDAAVERWVSTSLAASTRKPSTKALYAAQARSHLARGLGSMRLSAVRPSHVEALLMDLSTTLSPASVRTVYATARALFGDAVRDGLIARNPVSAVQRPALPHREASALDAADLARLLAAAKGSRLEALWLLLAGSGLRRGEALALRWSDLDGDVLRVRRSLSRIAGAGLVEHEPKTSRARRVVDLSPQLLSALAAHKARQAAERLAAGPHWTDADRVFASTIGTPLDPRTVNREFARIAKQARVSATPHTLRHSVASHLIAAGHPVPVVSALLGHSSSVGTMTVYAHALPTQRKAASAALGLLLDESVR